MDNNTNTSRRKLLNILWTTPVVASVSIPSHAEASLTTTTQPTTTATTPTTVAPCVESDLTVSFSGDSFLFNSDEHNIQSQTMQVTNTSPVAISLSGTATPSSKGESYALTFNPVDLTAGETGSVTLEFDGVGLSTFCTGFDGSQSLDVLITASELNDCSAPAVDSPSINIEFGC